ncbi:MAG: hypothetical protein AB1439_07090 [candidate division FCPU426 bacterium]
MNRVWKLAGLIVVLMGLISMHAIPALAATSQAGAGKTAGDAKAKTGKPKDKYRYPKIIGQSPEEIHQLYVRGEYLYVILRSHIARMSVNGGKLEALVSSAATIKGFAMDVDKIYFTHYDSTKIYEMPISGGETSEFADTADTKLNVKIPTKLTVDDDNVYCVVSMSLIKVPKAGGDIISIVGNMPFIDAPLWVDENTIYWSAGSTVYMRDKERDIADIYTLGSIYLCYSMSGNEKAFYYADTKSVGNDELVEVRLEDKKIISYPIPTFSQFGDADIYANSIACDEEQVYVSATSGVWFKKTGADSIKLVEDTKDQRCRCMTVDDKYIYFAIRSNIFKMTKPKYE